MGDIDYSTAGSSSVIKLDNDNFDPDAKIKMSLGIYCIIILPYIFPDYVRDKMFVKAHFLTTMILTTN